MPQMAPISWLSLFIMFTFSLMIFSLMNYYNTLPTSPKTSTEMKLKPINMNWKW